MGAGVDYHTVTLVPVSPDHQPPSYSAYSFIFCVRCGVTYYDVVFKLKRAFLQNSDPLRVPHLLVYRSSGCVPYLIPVGGSNPIGSWGYIEAFRELMEQVRVNDYSRYHWMIQLIIETVLTVNE